MVKQDIATSSSRANPISQLSKARDGGGGGSGAGRSLVMYN